MPIKLLTSLKLTLFSAENQFGPVRAKVLFKEAEIKLITIQPASNNNSLDPNNQSKTFKPSYNYKRVCHIYSDRNRFFIRYGTI